MIDDNKPLMDRRSLLQAGSLVLLLGAAQIARGASIVAVRQAQVWRHLQQQFVDEELQRVEFVFTQTPTERAA